MLKKLKLALYDAASYTVEANRKKEVMPQNHSLVLGNLLNRHLEF